MNVRPFQAVRPTKAAAADVAAVPYDVVDAEEARALAAGNPVSFLHVSRPEIDMPAGADCSSDAAYAQAKRAFDALRTGGAMEQDAEPRYYLYRQTMGAHVQTGLVAVFDTKDYISGALKQHERTRRDKEDDRTRHIEILRAHTGPAYLAYADEPEIDAVAARVCEGAPRDDFTAPDGVRHTVWDVPAADSDAITAAFARVPAAYIADGHHRSAAAARYAKERNFEGESRWFLAVAFPASQLRILPYNRLVADLNGLSGDAFLAKVRETFAVSEADGGAPAAGRHARMFLGGRWYDLSWEVPADADVVSSLDVSVLQDRLLAPILGIDDPRTSPRISFMGGIRGTDALADKVNGGAAAVAFSMYPVTVGEMMAIADAGAIMPPKSTWFEPKLRSGLFVHVVD